MTTTTTAKVVGAALVVAMLVCAARSAPYAGPYISYGDYFSPCEEVRGHLLLNVSLSPFNKREPLELQKMDGNIVFDYPDGFDDTNWIRVRLDQRSNHEWKLNAFIFNFPVLGCSTVRNQVPGFYEVVLGQELTDAKTCHVTPGNRVIRNQPVNWTFPNFPVMPYGHWRFHLRLGKGKRVIGCTNVICHTIPKPKH